ncbi:MAG: hypothetical protein NTW74_00925 [Acidobacteria bacterium]|nr:hypothetical protein [Acidobacteriota bacterium]
MRSRFPTIVESATPASLVSPPTLSVLPALLFLNLSLPTPSASSAMLPSTLKPRWIWMGVAVSAVAA